ncbi:MAG: hypothetical protein DWI28_06315, partial [Planctomycetota bacterium]
SKWSLQEPKVGESANWAKAGILGSCAHTKDLAWHLEFTTNRHLPTRALTRGGWFMIYTSYLHEANGLF